MALKVGTEDKKKVYLAGGLGLVMLVLLIRFLWQNFGPSPAAPPAPVAVVAPAPRVTTSTAGSDASLVVAGHPAAKLTGLASLDPTLHPEIMRQTESLEYTGRGRNIFSLLSAPVAIPKPIAPIRQAVVNTGPPPPPPPPPITLGFYGYAAEKSGQKTGLSAQGRRHFYRFRG